MLHVFLKLFWPYRPPPPLHHSGNSNPFCGGGGEYRYFVELHMTAEVPIVISWPCGLCTCLQIECPKKTFSFTVGLFNQAYKQVPGNLLLGQPYRSFYCRPLLISNLLQGLKINIFLSINKEL